MRVSRLVTIKAATAAINNGEKKMSATLYIHIIHGARYECEIIDDESGAYIGGLNTNSINYAHEYAKGSGLSVVHVKNKMFPFH